MAWLREIGLEFVDIIVKPDNEPALTSLIEPCVKSNEEWIEIIANSPVGSSKSNWIVEGAIQPVQWNAQTNTQLNSREKGR